jgi:toxin ParE1/3/4
MMAERLRVEYARSAHDDLRAILEWCSFQQGPAVGEQLVAEIFVRVEQAAVFPDSGWVVPEFETPSLRELEHPPFRIVYRRDEGLITVVRVWRSERLMDRELGGNA